MVDPIGAVSLGIQVCSGLLEYYNSWKDSSKDVTKMCESLARISKMFVSIQHKIEREQLHGSDVDRVGDCISSCTGAINDMNMKLKKFRESASRDRIGRIKQFAHRLQYPFEQRTLLELKANVSDIRAELTEAMMILHMDVSVRSSSKIHDLELHMAQDVVPGIKDIQINGDNRLDREDMNAILAWLSGLSPSTFTDRQNASLNRRKKNTGAWIFEEEEMKRWLDGTTHVLWCPGDPGCGKSVSMSMIVEHLLNTRLNDNIAVAYTYCVYNQEHQSASYFLASLLAQFARQARTIDAELRKSWHKYRGESSIPVIEEYVRLLKTLSSEFSKAFILIDALDEFPEAERRIFVSHLMMLTPAIQVLVTSRGILSIQSLFSTAARMEIRSQEEDMRIALASRIEEEDFLKELVEGNPPLHDNIIETIIRKAKGMFLVAELHITALSEEDNIRDLYEKLESLPAEISDTYTQSLARIESQNRNQAKRAHQVLLWLAHAFRPLRVRELQQALAVRPGDTEFVHGGEPSIEALVSSCMGLVIIDKQEKRTNGWGYRQITVDIIRYVHYTAQEYFEQIRCQRFPNGHYEIAESCLNILSLSNLNVGICHGDETVYGDPIGGKLKKSLCDLEDSLPIIRYASQHWGDHARLSLEAVPGLSLQAAIRRFLQEPNNLFYSIWVLQRGNRFYHPHPRMSALHLLANFGIASVMWIASETLQAIEIDARDADYRTPLHIACINGHLNDIKMLIKHGADKNAEDVNECTALALAIVFGRSQAVRLLLDTGADDPSLIRKAIYRSDDTILQMLLESFTDRDTLKAEFEYGLGHASKKGQESVVRTLLHASQAFDEHQYWKSKALVGASYYASSDKEDALVRLLLDEGADPNFEDSTPRVSEYLRAQTPLSSAAGSIDTVKLLVQHGAVVDFKDSNGRTPLQSYLITSETAEYLITSGAAINNRDCEGRTPLHDAIELPADFISSLLDNHAEVDAQDEIGLTPLMVAVASYQLSDDECASRVKCLLQAGANVRIKDTKGCTALHYAVFNGHPSICETLLEHGAKAVDKNVIIQLAQLHLSLRDLRNSRRSRYLSSKPFDFEVQARHEHETMSILHEIGPSRLQANNAFLNVCLPYEAGFSGMLKAFLEAGVDIQGQWFDALIRTFIDIGLQNLATESLGILFDYGLPIDTIVGPMGTALCNYADFSSEMVAFFLDKGADVELGGEHGSPLMIAACGKWDRDLEEILALLLDYKADINKACDFPVRSDKCGMDLEPLEGTFSAGMTALHMCAASIHTSAWTVALLLGRGANIEAVTSSGETPLSLAVKCARVKMVKALLAQGADTTEVISMTEEDRMPGAYVESFRAALHMVQEAHRKRITEG